ncbi:MAG: hypothetical protein ACKVT1_04230 [Dehalococcoidia bacterium]
MAETTLTYPGGLAELDFVDAYWRSALKKPQMAADAALRQLVFAEAGDRAILTGLIGQELADACRRLVAVHRALSDRRYSIARSLLMPLPGVAEWKAFVEQAAAFTPVQMLRELNLDMAAIGYAETLRSQPDLAGLTGLVASAETGNAMLLVPGLGRRNIATECWLAGLDANGEPTAASFGFEESDAANLADLTADLSSIARGFLGSYLETRRTAGWRGG